MTLGYQNAKYGGMNPGIVSAVVSANTVYVLIASYFLFIEMLLPLQLLGAGLMIVAVLIVSIYRDEAVDLTNLL